MNKSFVEWQQFMELLHTELSMLTEVRFLKELYEDYKEVCEIAEHYHQGLQDFYFDVASNQS